MFLTNRVSSFQIQCKIQQTSSVAIEAWGRQFISPLSGKLVGWQDGEEDKHAGFQKN